LALHGSVMKPPARTQEAWLQDAAAQFGWVEQNTAIATPVMEQEHKALLKPAEQAPKKSAPSKRVKPKQQNTAAVSDAEQSPFTAISALGRRADQLDDTVAGELDKDTMSSAYDDSMLEVVKAPRKAASIPVGGEDGQDPLDQTIGWLDQDSEMDVDQYASDRGIRESLVLSKRNGNSTGWIALAILACVAGAAYAFKPQINDFAVSTGLIADRQLNGVSTLITLNASGASVGEWVWSGAQQRGHLHIEAMPKSVDRERQYQAWVIDNGRAGAAIPVALLRTNLVVHDISVEPQVLVKEFGGLLISSEPLGGSLVPSRGAVIAKAEPAASVDTANTQ